MLYRRDVHVRGPDTDTAPHSLPPYHQEDKQTVLLASFLVEEGRKDTELWASWQPSHQGVCEVSFHVPAMAASKTSLETVLLLPSRALGRMVRVMAGFSTPYMFSRGATSLAKDHRMSKCLKRSLFATEATVGPERARSYHPVQELVGREAHVPALNTPRESRWT